MEGEELVDACAESVGGGGVGLARPARAAEDGSWHG